MLYDCFKTQSFSILFVGQRSFALHSRKSESFSTKPSEKEEEIINYNVEYTLSKEIVLINRNVVNGQSVECFFFIIIIIINIIIIIIIN